MQTTEKRTDKIMEIPLADIESHPAQPRFVFDEGELQKLAESMKTHQLLQPIGVRRAPKGSCKRFQLLWGGRRTRAAELAGLETIQARVLDVGQLEALELIGTENLCRADWNPLEKAAYLETLGQPKNAGGAGLTNARIGRLFGHNEFWSTNLRRLLALPQTWKDRIASGQVSETKARFLLKFVDSPSVLAAIAEDLDRQPALWKTRDQFEQRAEMIARQFGLLDAEEPAEQADSPGLPAQRVPKKGADASTDAPIEESNGKQCDVHGRRFQKFLPLLAPFQNDLKALRLLRDLVDQLIAKLAGQEGGDT